MNEFGFDQMLAYKFRQGELQKEAAQNNLWHEAIKARGQEPQVSAKILIIIGKELVKLGTRLEGQNSAAPETAVSLSR